MKTSSDIWFIAFLMHKKIVMQDYRKKDHGKIECSYLLSDDEWKKLKIEFDNSDAAAFKSYHARIKDLLF